METMRAIRAIKLHSHEAMRESGWRNRYAEVISATYRSRIYDIQLNLAENLLFGLQLLLIVYLGALAVIDQRLTVGLLLAFLAYRSSFTGSAAVLGPAAAEVAPSRRPSGAPVRHRRREARGCARQSTQSAPARAGLAGRGADLRLRPDRAADLREAELRNTVGRIVAIVGPSGAGKTTLMRVLLGLLPPSSGKILIDGVPLGPATLGAWRGRIAAVMQDDYLLTGTFADNIAFFDPQLDDRQIEQCARLAWIHDDILKMPMGYQSLVSDMGVALSSGQRQRILLARALYRDPDALFLDEGTANLDEETEARIVDMIAALPSTRVVIAHRPAMIERADIVLRFDQGRLVTQMRPAESPRGRASNPCRMEHRE